MMEIVLSKLPEAFDAYSRPMAVVGFSLMVSVLLIQLRTLLPDSIKKMLGMPVKPVKIAAAPTKFQEPLPEPTITPVSSDFNWEKTEPVPYRPFKNGTYHMTMAIQRADPNDWIVLEETYLKATNLKIHLMKERSNVVMGCHPSAEESLKEFYSFTFDFLMKRYPMYFYKTEDGAKVYSKIRDESYPADPTPLERTEVLKILGRNIEEDFLILMKNCEEEEYKDEYVLRGFISSFPAGFNPGPKFNKPLTIVHTPVPDYKTRLQSSMNKFFLRLRVNEFIVRRNWSIQIHPNLYAPSGSHGTKKVHVEPPAAETVDFNKAFLRVEKQSFTRLPKTKANVMLIRTYTTPLTTIRAEGRGEDLCGAIDGLGDDLAVYKNRIFWGEAVKAYMRGETNGATDEVYKYDIYGEQMKRDLL
ncbi:hypothetical protein OGAPHI_002640 [Ogataea philodendri]|uniref:Uncharacterized protein n=1 Tax=Ogataea philodendri TaxID=1378263 RepID=A0A9P8T867_9ASCO|nr:uncharacterized protein OGAPHI_002640 [Ogataea philodendri]KAH3668885.1 hypothetical protein OGAPHI_002640 [Ogataea philodendri]